MFDWIGAFSRSSLSATIILFCAGSGALAQDAVAQDTVAQDTVAQVADWHVGKSSGEVWVTTSGAQPASLGDGAILKPGDNIRTGPRGRVLLTRGEERILIAPNSAIGIPTQATEGLSTTIMQQAGSILLDVEKRNVKHFEVETPYLAAVVKGTQFRVTVTDRGTSVDVLRGQVEVADFKSGQYALVLPGQAASVAALGSRGLSLRGTGALSPIQQGAPRKPSVEPLAIPKAGLAAPSGAANGQEVRALPSRSGDAPLALAKADGAAVRPGNGPAPAIGGAGALHIAAPLGEVKLDFQKVTKGLVGAVNGPVSAKTSPAGRGSVIGSGNANGNSNGNSNGNGVGNSNRSASVSGNASVSGSGSVIGNGNSNASAGSNGLGIVNAGSNNGSGKANGIGIGNSNGNGKGNSSANGNGRENGNGNNGNGKGKGRG